MKNKYVYLILFLAFTVRIVYLFTMVDLNKDDYNEYGYLAQNIESGRGFSVNYDITNELRPYFNINEPAYKSAYMPPAYVYYLVAFMHIDNIKLRNILLYSSQIILSILCIVLLYKLTNLMFNKRVALISILIYALLPELIYVVAIPNSIIHFHILLLLILYYTYKYHLEERFIYNIYITICFALGIYFRSDFALFLAFYVLVLIYQKRPKLAFIIFVISMSLLLPWQIRNYMIFNKYVFLTTNSGFNLYRGHYNGDDYNMHIEPKVFDELKKNIENKDFDIIQNTIYTKYAIEHIKVHILTATLDGFTNILKFIFIQYRDPRSINPFYLIPWLLMLPLSIYGFLQAKRSYLNAYIILFIVSNLITIFIFFAIPRYQTLAKIILLPYMAYSIAFLLDKTPYFNKATKKIE
ncbi:MAG TPA: glycosyltransferase family 39 protein [Candidatus Kapabacteria bacterium]|nr:glycosyltransferase family 39 protein [Candidatus Kapabacteria bacterium]